MDWYIVFINDNGVESYQMMSQYVLENSFEYFSINEDQGFWQNTYDVNVYLSVTYTADNPALIAQELQRINHGG